MSELITQSYFLAKEILANTLPARWEHVQGVARKTEEIAEHLQRNFIISEKDKINLIAAAWLHDIGYAPHIKQTGLHAIDGANWLRSRQMDATICALVAFHSVAYFEAQARDMSYLFNSWKKEDNILDDALTYADITTDLTGKHISIDDRLIQLRIKYPVGNPIHQLVLTVEHYIKEKTYMFETFC